MTPAPDSLPLNILIAMGIAVNVVLWGCIL